MTEIRVDKFFFEVYYIVIEVKGGDTMNQDSYTKMVRDGKDLIRILQSVPEDKRILMSAIAGAFIDGMIAQERLANVQRPSV